MRTENLIKEAQGLAALRRFLSFVPLQEPNEELANWIESLSSGSGSKGKAF